MIMIKSYDYRIMSALTSNESTELHSALYIVDTLLALKLW